MRDFTAWTTAATFIAAWVANVLAKWVALGAKSPEWSSRIMAIRGDRMTNVQRTRRMTGALLNEISTVISV